MLKSSIPLFNCYKLIRRISYSWLSTELLPTVEADPGDVRGCFVAEGGSRVIGLIDTGSIHGAPVEWLSYVVFGITFARDSF